MEFFFCKIYSKVDHLFSMKVNNSKRCCRILERKYKIKKPQSVKMNQEEICDCEIELKKSQSVKLNQEKI